MRVMRAYEIETNYQKHKKRLTSIKGFDARKKVTTSTSKNIQFINNYKKTKLTAEIFNEKQKHKNIDSTNKFMQKTLTKVYSRPHPYHINYHENPKQPEKSLHKNESSKRLITNNSVRSISSQKSRIIKENKKLSQKISGTKSQYAKFRETSRSQLKNNRNKQELIRLLEGQLGLKPSVVFPKVRKSHPNNVSDLANPSREQNKTKSSQYELKNVKTSNKAKESISTIHRQKSKQLSVKSSSKLPAKKSTGRIEQHIQNYD